MMTVSCSGSGSFDTHGCGAGSYGSTKRYKSFERLRKVNEHTIIGAGGELSDFQYILTLLEELTNEDFCADDGNQMDPKEIYAYLARVLYNRRSKCVSACMYACSQNCSGMTAWT